MAIVSAETMLGIDNDDMPRRTPKLISTDITAGVVYEAYGPVPPSMRDRAEEMMRGLSEIAPEPVQSARIKVKHDEERSSDQVVIAQGEIHLPHVSLRVEAAAPAPGEALDCVGEHLESKLVELVGERDGTGRPASVPGDETDVRPAFHHRPPERRTVVRRKTYSPMDQLTIDEALYTLEALDHRFYIFSDTEDGTTSVVYSDIDGYAVRRVDGSKPPEGSVDQDVHVNEASAPLITVAEAISRLNTSDMPFIFFRDKDKGRASVLYRRYDGHYGLLVPSTRIV